MLSLWSFAIGSFPNRMFFFLVYFLKFFSQFGISYIKWVLSTCKICDKNLFCWPYRRESLSKRKCFAPIICSTWFAQIELCLLQTHKKCNTNNFVHKRFQTEHRLLINRWGWKLKYFRLNFVCWVSCGWRFCLCVVCLIS